VSLKIDTNESLRLLKKLKKDNYFVIGWTINDKNFMEKLIKNNIDGIITDYPIKLKKILKKYA
jgi:glycerophosphoryl diester phosphodiesterase